MYFDSKFLQGAKKFNFKDVFPQKIFYKQGIYFMKKISFMNNGEVQNLFRCLFIK